MILRFPPRAIGAIVICKERNGDGWLALVNGHGWVCGSLAEARLAARWLSRNLLLPIREYLP